MQKLVKTVKKYIIHIYTHSFSNYILCISFIEYIRIKYHQMANSIWHTSPFSFSGSHCFWIIIVCHAAPSIWNMTLSYRLIVLGSLQKKRKYYWLCVISPKFQDIRKAAFSAVCNIYSRWEVIHLFNFLKSSIQALFHTM